MTSEMKEAVERLRLELFKRVATFTDNELERVIYEAIPNKIKFDGRCPYTDKPCEKWNCLECEVDKAERFVTDKAEEENQNEWFNFTY